MRNQDPDRRRGIKNERRFLRIVESMKTGGLVRRVEYADTKLDQIGIDVIVSTPRKRDGILVKVPFQIKSSAYGIVKYKRIHPDLVNAGVQIILINDRREDDSIRLEIAIILDLTQERDIPFFEIDCLIREKVVFISRQAQYSRFRRGGLLFHRHNERHGEELRQYKIKPL